MKSISCYINIKKMIRCFDKTVAFISRDVNFKLYYKKGGVYRENTVIVDFIKESDFKKLRQYQNTNYEELTSEEHVYYVSDSYKRMFLKSTGTQK